MVRESTITLEQVSTVAEQLQKKGIKPTSRAVLAEIGHGSMGTILKLLQQWQSNQGNQSQIVESTLDPGIAKAINNAILTKMQEVTAEMANKLAGLQIEADNLITENESQSDVIESQLVEQSKLQAQNSALDGRIQQLELEAIRTTTELSTERQSAEKLRISLAKAELRLEAVPKIELENEKLRAEIESLKIKVAESHQAEAVAIAKLEAAEQMAQVAREAAAKSNDAAEAIQQKYEQLLVNVMDKERTTAKSLENERLNSQSLQSINESAMRELISAQKDVKEAGVAQNALESAKISSQQHQAKTNPTDNDILSFNQTDPSEFNDLEELGVF